MVGFVNPADLEYQEPIEQIDFHFGVSRRTFVQVLGSGLMIAVCDFPQSVEAQQARRRAARWRRTRQNLGSGPVKLAARLHIGKDGKVTLLTGKVECGQARHRIDRSGGRRAASAGRSCDARDGRYRALSRRRWHKRRRLNASHGSGHPPGCRHPVGFRRYRCQKLECRRG